MLDGTTLGTLVELMVEAEVLAGSGGRLIPSRMEPDVDHRDIVVADVGGFGVLWLQVKGTTHPDSEGRIVAFANYAVDAVPESARLLYLVCLLDVEQHLLARTWLVPSADFNHLAYREHSERAGRVTLQFSCLASGDPRWDRFEVPRLELGARLKPLVAALGPARPRRSARCATGSLSSSGCLPRIVEWRQVGLDLGAQVLKCRRQRQALAEVLLRLVG